EVYFHYSENADGSIDVNARLFDGERDLNGLTVTFDFSETYNSKINSATGLDVSKLSNKDFVIDFAEQYRNDPITVKDSMTIDASKIKLGEKTVAYEFVPETETKTVDVVVTKRYADNPFEFVSRELYQREFEVPTGSGEWIMTELVVPEAVYAPEGLCVTVDADFQARVFQIEGTATNAPNLTLNSIIATGGSEGNIYVSEGANLVMNGGGVYDAEGGAGIIGKLNSSIRLNGVTVANNWNGNWEDSDGFKGTYGGGVSAGNATVYISDSTFNSNLAGGASAVYAANLYVKNSSFEDNYSLDKSGNGVGAIVVVSRARLTNALITDNFAETGVAGLVALRNSIVDVYNGTIVNNGTLKEYEFVPESDGSRYFGFDDDALSYDGVDLQAARGAKVALYNSIVGIEEGVAYDAENAKARVVSTNATISAENTLSSYTAWSNNTTTNFKYDGKDVFVGANDEDIPYYALVSNPQTIEAGDDSYVKDANGYGQYDLTGEADRVQGLHVDLGAYESSMKKETPSIIVTTLDDVVDAFDGWISLREAVEVYFSVEGRTYKNMADSTDYENTVTFDLYDYFADSGRTFNPNATLTITLDSKNGALAVADTMTIDATDIRTSVTTTSDVDATVETITETWYKLTPRYEQAVDENGAPIFDEEGNPVYAQEYATPSDQIFYDENGAWRIFAPVVDENGFWTWTPVVDEVADPIYLDADGKPSYVQQVFGSAELTPNLYDEPVYKIQRDENGAPIFDREPVEFTGVKPGQGATYETVVSEGARATGVTIIADGAQGIVVQGTATNAASLTLNQVSVTNGVGAGIELSEGANLVMNGGSVTNTTDGAGIVGKLNTSIYLDGVTVSDNDARGTSLYGGGVSAGNALVTIKNSTFTGNKAKTAGAVYAANLYVEN
ncbi:MAG: hypothetical protein IK077_02115, partial [Thermoguttaceae bacterium]|nr:hypothetical protein [Thermoguttaceae bacterium]